MHIIKNNFFGFFMLLILLNSIITVNVSSYNKNNQNNFVVSSTTQIIDDFSGFTKSSESAEIISSKTNQSIEMTVLNNLSAASTQWESYDYTFESNEGLTNFNIEVDCYYFYNGSMLNTLCLILGSYHNEIGELVEGNSICWCTIDDAWSTSNGVYTIMAFPNFIEDRRTTGIIAKEDNITFQVIRDNSTLSCSIKKSGDTIYSIQWPVSNGLTRDLDFIRLLLYATPKYVDYTNIQYTTILLTMNSTITPTSDFTFPFGPSISEILVVGSFSMLLVISLKSLVKSKKQQIN